MPYHCRYEKATWFVFLQIGSAARRTARKGWQRFMKQSKWSFYLNILLLALVVFSWGAVSALASIDETPAGTVISNQAVATYSAGTEVRSVQSNIVYVTVQHVPGLEVAPADELTIEVVAGQWVTVPFKVTNTGNGSDHYRLRPLLGDEGIEPQENTYKLYIDVNGDGLVDAGDILWPPAGTEPDATEPAYGPVAAGATLELLARLQVPNEAEPNEEIHIYLAAESKEDNSLSKTSARIVLKVVADGVVTGTLQGVSDNEDDRTKVAGDGNGKITYTVTVRNQSLTEVKGVKVVLTLPEHTSFVPGSISVNDVPLADPPLDLPYEHTIEQLSGGQDYKITYTVAVDNGTPGGKEITHRVAIRREGRDPVYTNETKHTVLHHAEVELSKPGYVVNPTPAGKTYDFAYTVTNKGNAADTIYLDASFAGDVPWPVSLYAADGVTPLPKSDGWYNAGIIEAGKSAEFLVKVSVPVGQESDKEQTEYVLRVKAFSKADPDKFDTDIVKLMNVEGPGVDLAVHADDAAKEAEPGQVVEYKLTVTNTGHVQDLFKLTAAGYPAEYLVQFFDQAGNPIGDVTIEGRESKNVLVRVTIPTGAPPTTGGPYTITVTATSQNNGTVFDAETLQLDVKEVVRVTVAPDRTGSVVRGGYTVYTLTVRNWGNTAQTLTLATDVPGGEAKLQYRFFDLGTDKLVGEIQNLALQPGESQAIRVRVDALTEIAVGTVEVAGVVAKVGPQVLGSAVLTTTVTGGELLLEKNVNGVEAIEAAPGEEVTYTVKATNLSVIPLEDLVIYEKVPQHTVFVRATKPENAELFYWIDAAGGWVSSQDAANYSGPVIEVKWAFTDDLAANASVEVSFTVQIK